MCLVLFLFSPVNGPDHRHMATRSLSSIQFCLIFSLVFFFLCYFIFAPSLFLSPSLFLKKDRSFKFLQFSWTFSFLKFGDYVWFVSNWWMEINLLLQDGPNVSSPSIFFLNKTSKYKKKLIIKKLWTILIGSDFWSILYNENWKHSEVLIDYSIV